MASRTERLLGPAREFYVGASDSDRRELDRIIHNLTVDPLVDQKMKFVFSVPPAIMTLYQDGRFWIVYRLPDGDSLLIYNIGRASSRPIV